MKIFRFDTETYPIRPGLLAPKIVCLQYAFDVDGPHQTDGQVAIVIGEDIPDIIKTACEWADEFEAHNGAYDYGVLCANFPELTPYIFKMLSEGKGRDTYLREKLTVIKDGIDDSKLPKGYLALAGLVKRFFDIELDKGEETWRLRYALLDGIDPTEWPEEAVRYAVDDVTSLRIVSRVQKTIFQPEDEWFQCASAFALQLCAIQGMRVDPIQLDKMKSFFQDEADESAQLLAEAGLLVNGTVKKDKVQEAITQAATVSGIEIPRTNPTAKFPQGQVSTSAETCELFKDHDPVLQQLSRYTTANKMLETYLNSFDIGTRYAMTSRPNVLVSTNRTSWGGVKLKQTNPWWPDPSPDKYEVIEERSSTNCQNIPKIKGLRECLIPREGYYLVSVDYNSLELRTLGQALLWLVGRSKLAQGYRDDPNYDPHSEFAGKLIGVDYKTALTLKRTDKAFESGPRQIAKAANFSLPGGVGPRRLAEMFDLLFRDGQIDKPYSVEECRELRAQYLDFYPEMTDYFEIANHHSSSGKPLEVPVSGFLRGNVNYTAAANTYFQALGALCSKRALIAVSQACYAEPDSPLYGSRPLVLIHDEILAEVPIDKAHEASYELARIMSREAETICPDVPFTCEPALMTRWLKNAKLKFDEKGRLIPWDS